VKNSGEQPLFTLKGLLAGAVLFSVYGVILFSLDPEWVGWAGPLVFGGALYAADPPPPLFSSPEEALQMSSLFSLLSFFILGLIIAIRGERNLAWLSWLRAGLAGLWKARNHLRSRRSIQLPPLDSTHNTNSINSQAWNSQHLAVGEEDAATPPHTGGSVSRDLGVASPEGLQALHREAVSAESNDIL